MKKCLVTLLSFCILGGLSGCCASCEKQQKEPRCYKKEICREKKCHKPCKKKKCEMDMMDDRD